MTMRVDAQNMRIGRTWCTFCGFCVEACPVDAIRMDSGIISVVDYTRESLQFDKDRLQNTAS